MRTAHIFYRLMVSGQRKNESQLKKECNGCVSQDLNQYSSDTHCTKETISASSVRAAAVNSVFKLTKCSFNEKSHLCYVTTDTVITDDRPGKHTITHGMLMVFLG